MGNKVIVIDDQRPQKTDETAPLEVYRDISMVAESRNVKVFEADNEGTPVRRDRQMDFAAKEVNVKAIFNSLRNIFTWIRGERVLNPDFGSTLNLMLYEGITPENKEKIAAEIRGVCLKWEPRVNILKVAPVDSIPDTEDNTVQVDVLFTIPSLSTKQYQYSYIYDRTR